jgi:hypothetical protein
MNQITTIFISLWLVGNASAQYSPISNDPLPTSNEGKPKSEISAFISDLSINNKDGKPFNIQMHFGKRPVFACGNEAGAGDIAMLKYSQGSKYYSFQLIINHDQVAREFAYHEKDNASLNAEKKFKRYVVHKTL